MSLLKELRVAVRGLWKTPGFSAITILVLGLGIGATTAIFSVVEGVLLRPLPLPESDRVVQVRHVSEGGASQVLVSYPNYLDLQTENRSLQAMAAYGIFTATVIGDGGARRATAAAVTAAFFDVLGVQPALGRAFLPEEIGTSGVSAIVVGHDYWQSRLDGRRDLSEATVRVGDRTHEVVGVMPPGFSFPSGAELWLPTEASLANQTRTGHNFEVVGRLRDGVTLAETRADLSGVARRLKARFGDETWMSDAGVIPLREQLVGPLRPALTILLVATGLLLAVACANVANLLMLRAAARHRETAIRRALGAGSGRLMAHSFAEALILSVAGGALGSLLAAWCVPAVLALAPESFPRMDEVGVNGVVLLFAAGVSALTALVLPLLGAANRGRGGASLASLHGAGPRGGSSGFRARSLLAVSQVALSLVLLIGAGLLGRSFLRLIELDPGYRTEGGVVMDLWSPPIEGLAARREIGLFHDELEARLRGLPGVDDVGGVSVFPLDGGGSNGQFLVLDDPNELGDLAGARTAEEVMRDPELLARLWRMGEDPEREGYAEFRVASEGYFRSMGIPLVRGRLFDAQDGPDAPHVAVISRSLAETRWPGEDPLGKFVEYGNMDGDLRPLTVVGVVGDVREAGLEEPPSPTFYASARQRPGSTVSYHIVLEGTADGAALTAAREIAGALEPEVAVRFRTLETVFSASLAPRRFSLILLGVFTGAALLMALIGVYGTIAYLTSRRTHEIGIRMALGATRASVSRMVVREGLVLASLGGVVGLLGGYGFASSIRSAVYGVTALDPLTYLGAATVLIVAAALASWIPAARAAAVEPTSALKTE